MPKATTKQGADRRTGGQKAAGPDANGSRRDHIVALAAQLFAEKGVAATTVRDIGNAAGILSGSLYYHFDSKESIVKEIVRQYLVELVESYEAVIDQHADPRDQLDGLVRASFEAIHRAPYACEIFQNDYKTLQSLRDFDGLDVLTGTVQRLWMQTIDAGVSSGVLRSDVDAKLFYRFARDAIWFTVRGYRPDRSESIATLATTCTTILLDGFAAK